MGLPIKRNIDISDDEIRTITAFTAPLRLSGEDDDDKRKDRKPRFPRWGCLVVIVIIVLTIVMTLRTCSSDEEEDALAYEQVTEIQMAPVPVEDSIVEPVTIAVPHTLRADTIVNGVHLTILKPQNAVAKLVIGDSVLDAEEPVLVAQAADVRRDNRQIVGAYVIEGDMISRGKAKSGFCAIINNEITIGVAQTTPLLEKATEENGYFFRQYPLVYEGELIENRPENRSQRKALAVLNDAVVVVLSHERLSLHDFSEALIGLGVKNAIYLVGSAAYLKARLEDGSIYEFGKRSTTIYPNTNYIFWQ